MSDERNNSTDRVQLFGVIGLSVVAIVIIVLSGLLSLRGLTVPGSWETLAGAAVGSLGTLVVTKRSGSSTASIEQAHQQSTAAAITAASNHRQPPSQYGAFQRASIDPMIPQHPATPAAPQETGVYQGE